VRRRLTAFLIVIWLASIVMAQTTPKPYYSFQWTKTSFKKALDDAAQAFSVKVFLGDFTDKKLDLDLRVDNFDDALRSLTSSANVSWIRVHAPSGSDLSNEQIELLARSAISFQGLHLFIEDSSSQTICWISEKNKSGGEGEGEDIYFIGQPHKPQTADSTQVVTSTVNFSPNSSGISTSDIGMIFDAVMSMSSEQREAILRLLTSIEAPPSTDNSQTQDDISSRLIEPE
jgi:hypothetical protein